MSDNHTDDFAKIVRAQDGAQVLIYKDHNEDDEPAFTVVTAYAGVAVSVTSSFADSERGYAARNNAFEAFTQEHADKTRALVIDMVGASRGEL